MSFINYLIIYYSPLEQFDLQNFGNLLVFSGSLFTSNTNLQYFLICTKLNLIGLIIDAFTITSQGNSSYSLTYCFIPFFLFKYSLHYSNKVKKPVLRLLPQSCQASGVAALFLAKLADVTTSVTSTITADKVKSAIGITKKATKYQMYNPNDIRNSLSPNDLKILHGNDIHNEYMAFSLCRRPIRDLLCRTP
jgi:hypothetical protein